MKVQLAQSTHSAIPELNREERKIYFLLLGEGDEKITINIGEKSYNKIKAIMQKGENEQTNEQMNNAIIDAIKKGGKK